MYFLDNKLPNNPENNKIILLQLGQRRLGRVVLPRPPKSSSIGYLPLVPSAYVPSLRCDPIYRRHAVKPCTL